MEHRRQYIDQGTFIERHKDRNWFNQNHTREILRIQVKTYQKIRVNGNNCWKHHIKLQKQKQKFISESYMSSPQKCYTELFHIVRYIYIFFSFFSQKLHFNYYYNMFMVIIVFYCFILRENPVERQTKNYKPKLEII